MHTQNSSKYKHPYLRSAHEILSHLYCNNYQPIRRHFKLEDRMNSRVTKQYVTICGRFVSFQFVSHPVLTKCHKIHRVTQQTDQQTWNVSYQEIHELLNNRL